MNLELQSEPNGSSQETPGWRLRLNMALSRFKALYGAGGEIRAMRAPARINIIGEHVDYSLDLPTSSLTFGSREHDMLMIFRAADDGVVRGASTLEQFPPFSFALDEEPVEDQSKQDWDSFVFDRPAPAPHWSNYVKGAVCYARWKFDSSVTRGCHFLIDSTIPPKGGASSSSALVSLGGAAIREVNRIEYQPVDLATDSSQAEWYVGTRGGDMDHVTICLAKEDHVVHVSHWDGGIDLIPMPDKDLRWLTFFSHEADKGGEAMLEYNERAAVSLMIIPALRTLNPEIPATITLDEFARLRPRVFRECERMFPALVRERRDRPIKLMARLEHQIGELTLVMTAYEVISGTPAWKESINASSYSLDARMYLLGHLLSLSHQSLRDLYEVSTPEVERLITVINADPEVLGARLMGAGFGGSVLALTRAKNTRKLIERVQREYYSPRGRDALREGAVMVSTPGNGLELLDL